MTPAARPLRRTFCVRRRGRAGNALHRSRPLPEIARAVAEGELDPGAIPANVLGATAGVGLPDPHVVVQVRPAVRPVQHPAREFLAIADAGWKCHDIDVHYALADPHLARALGELVQVVLAVDPGEECLDPALP